VSENIQADICVIGGGSGGLSVAAGASQMGARVVLIERAEMGGDCLNTGCVPSKALIAAGHAAHTIRSAGQFGIQASAPVIDMARVRDHVKGVIAAIAPMDSVERFEGMGVTVLQASARFTGPREVTTDKDQVVRAKYFVIATGSRALVPPVPGLSETPYFTNETVFDNADPIEHLIVVGGGPIGVELAQAHRRLGAAVTVVEMFDVLGRDDPECAGIVKQRLREEGLTLMEGTKVLSVARGASGVSVTIERDGLQSDLTGTHLLIAAGRRPNVEDLDLAAAGIDHTPKGISVDGGMRTTNKHVFAIGDVAGGLQFTHMANYHAGLIIRQTLFKMFWAKADQSAFPWVTYTDPELAHVGMTEAEAVETLGEGGFRLLRWSFAENDRAQAEHATHGLIKVVTDRKGRVKGATIAGPHAGELIMPWVQAIAGKSKIGSVAGLTFPYPTLSEVSKRAAGSFFTPTLFSERTRKIVQFLLKF
jgi:pyruvate/2-oxoglutarate dehydrogenase complex dihydrolipoamide dehydrogenase (E3) component